MFVVDGYSLRHMREHFIYSIFGSGIGWNIFRIGNRMNRMEHFTFTHDLDPDMNLTLTLKRHSKKPQKP